MKRAIIIAGVVGTVVAGVFVALPPTDEKGVHPDIRDSNCWIEVPSTDDCDSLTPTGYLCRYGRLHGPGVGGENPNGTPAVCNSAAPRSVAVKWCPYVCTASSANFAEQHRQRTHPDRQPENPR